MKTAFFASCAALALAVPTIATAQTYVFDHSIGSFGSGNGQIDGPNGLTIDT